MRTRSNLLRPLARDGQKVKISSSLAKKKDTECPNGHSVSLKRTYNIDTVSKWFHLVERENETIGT